MTERLDKLKARYLTVTPSITINRALAYTAIAKEHLYLPPELQRAKSFKRACETAPLLIQDGELIIGHPCGKARAGAFSPDIAWEWLADELDTIDKRAQDPYDISEADKQIIREELFAFWKGKSLAEKCEESLREAGLWEYTAEAAIADVTYHIMNDGGDSSPGYDTILFKKGVSGLKEEAEEKLEQILGTGPEDDDKRLFYMSEILVCEGIMTYAQRLADYARTLADNESDVDRKQELIELARINATVPKNPPQTFQEALQAIWTIQSLFVLEGNQCSTSLGRLDQYLYPFYQKGLEEGTLRQEEAFELLGCFFIKCSEVIWYTPSATATYFAGYMPFINMCVGGLKREGGDGTNELTYLIMETVGQMKLYQPTLACRVHNLSPQTYLEKIVDLIKVGGGMPAVHFDDAHIKMMLKKGYSFEDARDYSLMGCVEPQRSGKVHQWTAGGFTQWPVAIEMALNQGALPSYSDKSWLNTGALDTFTNYSDFETAVRKQLDYLIDNNCQASLIIEKIFKAVNPDPYMSLFIEGCMDKGKDVMAGGACLYQGPGTIFAGLGTYADSMAAIKHLVFDTNTYSLQQLKDAMDANWEGYAQCHRDCLAAPKYGNDEDYVDEIAKKILDYTEQKLNSYPSLYAHHIHGTLSQSFNTPLGEMIGATPDGRKAFAPLSDGMSPSQGADKKGPTAVIKSVSKLNVESMSLGMAHNFKLTPGFLETNAGKQAIVTLLKTASHMGNGQMQFNCVDNQTLIEAQKNPNQHRDLIVRVAGYCAYFVELCKDVQDEIISRTVIY